MSTTDDSLRELALRTFFQKCRRITHIVLPMLCIALGCPPASASAQRAKTTRAPREIVKDLLKDTTWIETPAPPVDSVAADVVAEPLDLNGDGAPELEVMAIGHLCHSNANCPIWIYRRAGAGYERLLDAGNIALLEAQQTFTHGYRDIMTTRHGSAWHSDLTLYRFDGREYRRSACFSWSDILGRDGEYRELKKPRITRVACQPDT